MVDRHGRLIGLVFAADLDASDAGYALPLIELAPMALKAVTATAPVSAESCSG